MKKKNIMVRYTLVPNSEDGILSNSVKCLVLTKTKVAAFFTIVLVTLGILMLTLPHSDVWTFKKLKNSTECLTHGNHTCGKKSGGHHKNIQISAVHRRCFKHGKCSDGTKPRQRSPFFKKRLPQALIIGARKAGTRALLRFISLHRDVVASKKETHFFDRNYHRGFDWYLSQMPRSYPHQITVEKTPNYFVDWDVPELVHSYNSSIKLLLILRNPIDRAVSDYIQLKLRKNPSTRPYLTDKEKEEHPEKVPTFEKLVVDQGTGEINRSYAPVKRSLYSRHLEKWLAFFDLSQILIVDGENIKVRPWEEITKVEKFLGIPSEINSSRFIFNASKGFYCVKMKKNDLLSKLTYKVMPPQQVPPFQERCLNPSKGREHPVLEASVQRKLEEFYRPFNKRLFAKIGRTYDWF